MGRIIIYGNKSGEGGADTSVVTANASDVLIGKIIVNFLNFFLSLSYVFTITRYSKDFMRKKC